MPPPFEPQDVNFTISFAGQPGTDTTYRVERSTVSATEGFLVLGEHLPLLAERAVYNDSTAPIGVPLYYRAVGEQTGSVVTGAGTIPALGHAWVKDPGRPWADQRFDLCDLTVGHASNCDTPDPAFVWGGLGDLGMQMDAGLFDILNSETPADVWARRKYAASSMTFFTRTLDAIDRVYDLFTGGGPLLIQLPDEYGWHDHFVQPGDLVMKYGSRDQRRPLRSWTVPFTVTDRPPGPSQGTVCANWCAVEDTYATYADFDAVPGTYLDLLQGEILCPPVPLTPPVSDTFSRMVSGGWGTADTGQVWSVAQGPPGDVSVDGSRALHSHPALNVPHATTIPWPDADAAIRADFTLDFLPTAGAADVHLAARYSGVNDFYSVRVQVASGGAIEVTLRKRVAGVDTQLSTQALGVYVAGVQYTARMTLRGPSLQAKVWPSASGEPSAWTTVATDASITTAGSVGYLTLIPATLTNPLPVHFYFDNLAVSP